VASYGMLHCVALVKSVVSEERSATIFRMTRIGELGITLTVTSNRSTLRILVRLHSISSQRASVASCC
jgi:hypothetical protein